MHGPSIFAVKAKIYGVLYKQSSSIAFDETSSYRPSLKRSWFLGFSLVATRLSDYHWSAFRNHEGIHLPKRTETSLITETDQSRANHQLLQLCTVRTAWSDSDQAVRAVHSCKSWLYMIFGKAAGAFIRA